MKNVIPNADLSSAETTSEILLSIVSTTRAEISIKGIKDLFILVHCRSEKKKLHNWFKNFNFIKLLDLMNDYTTSLIGFLMPLVFKTTLFV